MFRVDERSSVTGAPRRGPRAPQCPPPLPPREQAGGWIGEAEGVWMDGGAGRGRLVAFGWLISASLGHDGGSEGCCC